MIAGIGAGRETITGLRRTLGLTQPNPMLIALVVAALAPQTQQTVPPPPAQRPSFVRDSTRPDTSVHDEGRRLPVTAAVLATAFKNRETRDLF
jgi:hypothetical protein